MKQPRTLAKLHILSLNLSTNKNNHFVLQSEYRLGYTMYVSNMLRKEIRAVKLVFLQQVKEVTTDGAHIVRHLTDTQY